MKHQHVVDDNFCLLPIPASFRYLSNASVHLKRPSQPVCGVLKIPPPLGMIATMAPELE